MQDNIKAMIDQMNDKWHIICQSLTNEQIKTSSYSIDLISKNLANIEATENGTINQINWYDYLDLCWQIYFELADMVTKLPDKYMFTHEFYFDCFGKNLYLYMCNKYETKLNELTAQFDKLSVDDQSRVNTIKYQIWLIDDTMGRFFSFSNQVGIIDKDLITNANNDHSRILQNLAESKLILLNEEIRIYGFEHFYIHDYGTKKIKPN